MKLDHYEMLQAFDSRDVPAILRIIEQHYDIKLPRLDFIPGDISANGKYNRDRYQMRIDADGISYIWHAARKFLSPVPNAAGFRNCCQVWW